MYTSAWDIVIDRDIAIDMLTLTVHYVEYVAHKCLHTCARVY